MELLTRDVIRTLVQPQAAPCVSIYQPTHRRHPDNAQDPLRFRNLLRTAEESLRRTSGVDVDALLAPLQRLAGDAAFWNHTLDGLAVLATAGSCRVFHIQRPVGELAVVAGSFHVKPLIRVVQSADRYQVLCLTRHSARMLEGNRDALDELDPGDFPTTITAALGDELSEPHLTVASYGSGVGGPAMRHGHGSRKDELDKDDERYFRAVDRAALEQFSKPSGLPLILAALPEHQGVFRSVSQSPALLPAGVNGNPESFGDDRLRQEAWRVVEPQYLARLAALREEFTTAEARGKGTADLSDAARAAVEGRVATLLVEADRERPGRMELETGRIDPAPLDHPEAEDLLDDLAEAVLRTGGDVVVVPTERMPTTSGLAAILRY